MSRTQLGVIALLVLAILMSAIGVVYAKYLSRKHFVDLQELQLMREQVAVEWGRLQLEESTLATHSKVESMARGRLDMHLPHIDEVMVIRY